MRQQDRATINFLTRIPFYKVSEEFREGQETRMKRRDLRPGQQRAIAECIEQDEMRVNIAWDGDMPGRVHETFQLNERGQMIVRGTMIIGDRELVVTQVYNKEK